MKYGMLILFAGGAAACPFSPNNKIPSARLCTCRVQCHSRSHHQTGLSRLEACRRSWQGSQFWPRAGLPIRRLLLIPTTGSSFQNQGPESRSPRTCNRGSPPVHGDPAPWSAENSIKIMLHAHSRL
ncbi:hypothetical protein BDV10DRAFT_72935 [Aspergillus recurvatus]